MWLSLGLTRTAEAARVCVGLTEYGYASSAVTAQVPVALLDWDGNSPSIEAPEVAAPSPPLAGSNMNRLTPASNPKALAMYAQR